MYFLPICMKKATILYEKASVVSCQDNFLECRKIDIT